jgi:hypothetical protein
LPIDFTEEFISAFFPGSDFLFQNLFNTDFADRSLIEAHRMPEYDFLREQMFQHTNDLVEYANNLRLGISQYGSVKALQCLK